MRNALTPFRCVGLAFGLFCLQTQAAPQNDNFADRLEITLPFYHFDGSSVGATSEPGEPLPAPGETQTLWWKFLAPEDCKLVVAASAPLFWLEVAVYEGGSFGSMVRRNPLSGTIYRLEGDKQYSVQLATSYAPGGDFTLDTQFYSVTNDMFASATLLEGTNITYTGNYTGATLEPNEPSPPSTNTVWARWTAPYTGRVTVRLANSFSYQYCTFYTGATLDALEAVPCYAIGSGYCSFLALEGTVYSIQFAGVCDNFTLYLHQDPLVPCTNDNFADAQVIRGQVMYIAPASVLGATMELGEPAHMGAAAQKSIWWKWQAPLSGTFYLSADTSLVGNMVLALYTGDSVEVLTLISKATNAVQAPVVGGNTYYIAGAVRADALGDVGLFGQILNTSSGSRIVPGNLLQEPSWEGTFLSPQYWHWTGDVGGYVNERGGADGTTWPCLGGGTILWQDIPTVSGHQYSVKFAYYVGGALSQCCGDARIQVSFDGGPLGIAEIPEAEAGFWHWAEFSATATNTTSRVSFQNLARNLEMDAFSVVDMSAPPTILTQPGAITTVSGGTAVFIVGAKGAPPLYYQWFFNGAALTGGTTAFLVLNPVSTNQAGSYAAVITNVFGAVTSSPATLTVDAPAFPTLVWQPYGDTVSPGAYFSFNAAAIGSLPLSYQWFFNSDPLLVATNKSLVFTNVVATDAGVYQVRVQNPAGTVWSLPATLRVGEAIPGGGLLRFANRGLCGGASLDAPILDVDGVTPLSGLGYLAQLCAGPSVALLRPAGQAVSFTIPGFVQPQTVTLANVPPTSNAVVQVRAWDAARGNTYEEARALGGRFGKSDLLSVCVGGGLLPAQCLAGLRSFSLGTGLPEFTVGTVQFVERRPPNTVVWAVTGQPGFRYLIEKAGHDFVWQPYLVVTNATGSVTFTDSASSGSAMSLYRARILD